MFIEISDLKGLIIDLDSFSSDNDEEWEPICNKLECLFYSSSEESIRRIQERYPSVRVVKKNSLLLRTAHVLRQFIKDIGLHSYEVAFVTRNINHIIVTLSMPVGTILISDSDYTKYEDVCHLPDYILESISRISCIIDKSYGGHYSEAIANIPGYGISEQSNTFHITLSKLAYQGTECKLVIGGRYYARSTSKSNIHQLSQRIIKNKDATTQYKLFTNIFEGIIEVAERELGRIDSITRVPPKPGKGDRFATIVENLCNKSRYRNDLNAIECISDYPTQKNLGYAERMQNVKGKFKAHGNHRGEHIVMIDDIITTGATSLECARMLYEKGASKVTIVTLAANQLEDDTWGAVRYEQIKCLRCGANMKMRFNGSSNEAFFGCSSFRPGANSCSATCEYKVGINRSIELNDIYENESQEDDWEF